MGKLEDAIKRYRNSQTKKDEETSKSGTTRLSKLDSAIKRHRASTFSNLDSEVESVRQAILSADSWQTEETMSNTRSAIETTKKRVEDYVAFRKEYGITEGDDKISKLLESYDSILGDWDKRAGTYANYESKEAYDKAQKDYNDKSNADTKALESELKSIKKILKEAKEYQTNISNKKKGIQASKSGSGRNGYVYTTEAEKSDNAYISSMQSKLDALLKENGYSSFDDLETKVAKKEIFFEDAKVLQEKLKLNKEEEERAKSKEGKQGYDKWVKLKEEKEEEEEGRSWWEKAIIRGGSTPDTSLPNSGLSQAVADKMMDDSSVTPNEKWTTDQKYTWGSYYMEDPDKAFDYGARVNNLIGKAEQDEHIAEIVESATSDFWGGLGHTAGSVVTKAFGIVDYLDDLTSYAAGKPIVESGDVTPFEYAQAVQGGISTKLNEDYGTLPDSIPIVGDKGWGDAYGLGTSIIESNLHRPLGALGTGISFFGQGAAAGVDDALSRGATDGEALLHGTLVGGAEGISEALGMEKLLGRGSSRTLGGFFKNANAQATSEMLEEGFSSIGEKISDNFVMGEKSKFNSLVKQYLEEGKSLSEAKSQSWLDLGEEIGYDSLGGYISGGAHMLGPINMARTINNMSTDTHLGEEFRKEGRLGEVLEIASLTPQDSEAYKLYSSYNKKGINAENIKDRQAGLLYSTAKTDTMSTIADEKATPKQRMDAFATTNKLNKLHTDKAVKDNKGKLHVGEESKVDSSGESINVEGVKLGEDTKIVTSNGEVSVDDATLSDKDATLVAYAQTMEEETANLFIEQYDGESNVHAYANSFNLVSAYAENNFDQNTIIENKGTLSTDQVKAIYNATVVAKAKAKQKALDDISAKHGSKAFVKGTFNDSIINYSGKSNKNQVNWNSLTTQQRAAIKFARLFSKATGVNIELIKSEVVNGKHKGKNGSYNSRTNTIEIDVYAGRVDAKALNDAIIPTLSHEITHWMKAKAISAYNAIKDDVLATLSKEMGISSEDLIKREIARLKEEHSEINATPEKAIDEIVARACEDMLSNSNSVRKLLNTMSAKEQKKFLEKLKETFDNLMQWIDDLLYYYKSNSIEAVTLRAVKEDLERISKQWDAMLMEAIKTNQSLQHEGVTGEEVIGKLAEANELQFNERLVESHMEKLQAKYSEDATIELDTLLERYQKIIDIWKKLGGELNSKFLDEWNNKVGKDRVFSVFKAQAGYKYNVELSSMCKKGIPLFEAIDRIVKAEVIKELNTKTLGKAEKEILYDILKDHNFEIPCAICYVEQARQREGVVIDAFLNGKIERTKTGKITQYKLGWNETLAEVQAEMKAAGCDYTFPALDRSIATDKYAPKDISMDEETQEYFYEALKKVANKEIRRYNKAENKNRKLITKTDAKSISEVFKGKLPLNLAMFKTMFTDPSSRFTIEDDLLYSSMTTQNLANMHNGLYGIFNMQGGVGGYKTKQGTIVYWGDILNKNWKSDTLRNEGGVRNQSNSDFLMYTLLDHAQMYIDFSAKGYYLQAYTKVLAELKLFGLSKGKINASFIPKVHEYKNSDGSIDVEKTRLYAGLDENGNLIFDDFEGINHKEAFMLLEDAEYSKSIGGVCIGYSDNHILKLLDDKRIQLIIGFHDKSNDPDKRYRGAKYSKNYNGLNEATYYDKEGNLKTKHIGFNQFVRRAEGKFKNGKESVEFNGKTYQYNDIPKLATDLYLEHCEKKGFNPAYSQGGTDFSKHENYYKLLADFSLYDINGNYAPHQKVEYNMPDQVPYLDENGNKAYEKTEDYIKRELEKELKVRDSISEALADDSENGIIPQFVKRVNELHSETQYSDREKAQMDSEYLELAKDPQKNEARLREMVEDVAREKGYDSPLLYHGTKSFGFTKIETVGVEEDALWSPFFVTNKIDTAQTYSGATVIRNISDRYTVDSVDDLLTDFVYAVNRTAGIYNFMGYGTTDFDEIIERVEMGEVDAKTEEMFDEVIADIELSLYENAAYYEEELDEDTFFSSDEMLEFSKSVRELWEGLKAVAEKGDEKSGNYQFYANTNNLLVIDGQNNFWNRIPLGDIEEDFNKWLGEKDIKRVNTRDISRFAIENGYSGVKIENIWDDGGRSEKSVSESADVYIFFNPQAQVKSADPVTYDDNGNIIPLSERFNKSNPDIRYSDRVSNKELAQRDDSALYIKNTKNANYIKMIFNGAKTEETRSRRTLDAFIGKDFYVTDGEYVYGTIVLGEPHKYTESEFHKRQNQLKHRVPKGDEYDIKQGGIKWAYPIESYSKFDKPKKLSDSKEYKNSFQARQIMYSDRQTESIYDKMGEADRVDAENERLKADIETLSKVIGDTKIPLRRFRSLADHLKKQSGSEVNRELVGDMLEDAYTYIQSTEDLEWTDVMAKTYSIAKTLLDQNLDVPVNYFKEVMSKIRKDAVTLSEEQKAKATEMFGGYSNFHRNIFGRVNVTSKGTPLSDMWNQWSKQYPTIFKADIKGEAQIEALADIVSTLKATSSAMGEFEREEAIRHLSIEVYNQFWNIAADNSESAKGSRAEHRKMMEDLRKDYEARQKEKTLHPVGETALKYEQLYKKMEARRKSDVAKAKKVGREMMDEYKDSAARKTKIQSITANALTLNKWLVKNSKDEHIHIAMREPVINLLNAIDFSSKQLLGMKGSANKGTPTKKDISLQKALSQVRDMFADATAAKEGLISLYGHDMDEELKSLAESVDNIMRTVGDNEYVLNKMSLAELQTLDKVVKTIKHAVNYVNEFHKVRHKQGIANLSQEGIEHLDSLGKQLTHSGLRGKLEKLLKWSMKTPYYAFKMLGNAGKKVFEALQDGWDKLAFNVNQIIEFTEEVYSDKEVRGWSKETESFTIKQADGSERTFEMSIAHIMALHCVCKQEDAMRHLLSSGMTIASFDKKGKVISEEENILLSESDITEITSRLKNHGRALEVADKLQEFMNTVCASWGNEVSMERFAIEMFNTPNYFPIKVSSATITKEEPEGVNDVSLFRLLNMSFTKSRNEYANQSIEIGNIFDIFAQHTSDMAKYNALALPVLDAYKWYSYKGQTDMGKEYSTYASLTKALGKDSVNYFNALLKDINGASNVARDNFSSNFFRNAKLAAVANNLRVVLLQPTSYVRASAVIDNRYLAQAFLHKPKIAKAKKHCGMALWKSLGYYDVNITKGVADKIKHEDTWKDKAIEMSMKGAEKADEITIGYLWNACELEIRKTRKDLKVGSEEFYTEIGKRLREVIYATQVVDSTMTRSHIMRSTDNMDKILTAFMSESTLSYNMLMDCVLTTSLDKRKNGKGAIKRNFKRNSRVFIAYTLTNALAALVESCWDAIRGDDEDEEEEFISLYLQNFASDMGVIGKIPFLKDILSTFKGYSASRIDTQFAEHFVRAFKSWAKVFDGEGEGQGKKAIENTLRAFSSVTGLAFYNAYRDFMAILDKLDILTAEELEEIYDDLFGQ
jgi:hypothetical protein